MKLDVKVNKNSISFIGETGEIFNIEKNASLDLNDFINFIEDEHKFYYSKCDYRIVREYTPVESPRKSDDFSKIIVIDGAIRIDEHNYITIRQFLRELAGKADSKALKNLDTLKCFFSIYGMTEAEYLRKLLEVARKKFLVIPLVDSGISEFDEDWKSTHLGYIYVSYSKIAKVYGDTSDKTLEIVKNRLKKDFEQAYYWERSATFKYKLVKVDENGEEVEEIDSYGLFYGYNVKENGFYDVLPEKYRYLLDESKIIYR